MHYHVIKKGNSRNSIYTLLKHLFLMHYAHYFVFLFYFYKLVFINLYGRLH